MSPGCPCPMSLFYSDLSDEAAAQIADFLHELAAVFEHHYFAQIRRHHQEQAAAERDARQLDFFKPYGNLNDPF